MSDKFLVYHKRCNGPAFFYAHKPVAGERILRDRVTLMSGKTPASGSDMICGNCFETLRFGTSLMPAKIFDMSFSEDMETLYSGYKGGHQ